jgi:photosystem II stability/assembly factor-like uncharacterized protein
MKLCAIIFLLFFYTSSSAQWEWLNPKPSGYGCSKVIFTDSLKGFIHNSNGDLMVTTNQGGNWHVQKNFPLTVTMDMKDSTGVICGYAGTIYISRDNGNTWVKENTGISDYFLMADVVSRDTLFLANNNGKIYRSDDGGSSWKTFNCGIQISSIEFINSKVGYAGGSSTYILKTTDGGQTWQQNVVVNVIPSNTLAIKFFDLNNGFAYREHSKILRTTDGGNTWTPYDIGDDIFSFYFVNATTAFACGEHGVTYRTNDGGLTWQWISLTGRIYAYDLSSLYFFNSNTGFTVGARGRILKTTDGGATWNTYSPTYIDVSDLSVATPTTAYATVGNNIYKTTDRGQTWNVLGLTVGTNYAEYDVFQTCQFFSADTGFVTASDYARIYKTYDGGANWRMISPTASFYDDVTCQQFLDKNTGFLAINIFYGGTIVKTKDGGETWNEIWHSQFNGEVFHKIYFLDEKTGYASRYDRLFKTTDSARTWTELWDDQTISSIWFINTSTGFVAGENGMLKQTLDSGRTWNNISIASQFYDDIYTIRFFNNEVGYLTAENGIIYRTINSGNTWKQYGRASFYPMRTIHFAPDSTVYIAGQWGAVLRSAIREFKIDSLDVKISNNCTTEFSAALTSILDFADSISFQYGVDTFNHDVNANPTAVSNSQKKVTASVNNLAPSTRYKVRVKLFHNGQFIYSNDTSFTTSARPVPPVISPPGNMSICAGDSTILMSSAGSGNQWYLNNTAISAATNQNYIAKQAGKYQVIRTVGCYSSDTSLSVTINIVQGPSAPVITATGNVLSSSSTTGNQWYLNNTPIPGATLSTYTATQSGIYAVNTTINGCVSQLSTPYSYLVTGINNPIVLDNIKIFPNPTRNTLNIQNNDVKNIEIKIFNIMGMEVSRLRTSKKENLLDLSALPSGSYLVSIIELKTLKRIQKIITRL